MALPHPNKLPPLCPKDRVKQIVGHPLTGYVREVDPKTRTCRVRIDGNLEEVWIEWRFLKRQDQPKER